MLITIISFIIVLGVLIFIHEFGHYLTAKKAGVRVEEFALGFGPQIFSHPKGETIYSIRAIPLGGFCKMTGEFPPDEDMSAKEKEIYREAREKKQCFDQKSIWKRFAVIFMGPFMNFVLAILIFILIFSIFGLPIDSSKSTIIGDLIPGQPAAKAGFMVNDEILTINKQKVNNWNELANTIHNLSEQEISISYKRGEELKEVFITPRYDENAGGGVIGIYPKLIRKDVSFLEAIKLGFVQSWYVFKLTIIGFIQVITRKTSAEIGGPIMIASMVGQAARIGINNLLNLMAILSINLGIINLFPFPALDGGRIFFILIELVRGKPVNPEKEGYVHFIGFVLLMILMVFIIYQDIARNLF